MTRIGDNPYEPTTGAEVRPTGVSLTRLQWVLLALLAITLLFRGGWMTFSWIMQLSSLLDLVLSSHFYRAMFVKDATYGLTALVGGLGLFLHPRSGWWASTIHLLWYISWEAVIAVTAETFSWRLPVRHEPPLLFEQATRSLLFALLGLAILFWLPIMTRCNVYFKRRFAAGGSLFVVPLLVAFAVNWWSGLR